MPHPIVLKQTERPTSDLDEECPSVVRGRGNKRDPSSTAKMDEVERRGCGIDAIGRTPDSVR